MRLIGFTAAHKLRDPALQTLAPPDYDYHTESRMLIERVKESATNRTKWDKISFYDKKFLVRILIEKEIIRQFKDQYSFEDELLFIHGISAAEHDSMLQAWREKVLHDLVRPTTVIQSWGDEELTTFDGNRVDPNVATIRAQDFQAFIRVMPHSEYPSGSSCICANYAEFTDAFTSKYFNGTLSNLRWGPGGVDLGCNENSVLNEANAAFYGCKEGGFTISDMAALSEECGESRLWGGMHFGDSVSAGQEVCSGLGVLGMDYMEMIKNGSEFGSSHFKGMDRPQCSAQVETPIPTKSTPIPTESPTRAPITEIVNEVPLTLPPTSTSGSSSLVNFRRIDAFGASMLVGVAMYCM